MPKSLLEALGSGRVLLMDGAMGTQLQGAGLQPPQRPEDWNLLRPDAVRAIHRAYVESGAEILLTNTFQANPLALRDHPAGFFAQTIRAAASLARAAAGAERHVLLDIGPIAAPGGSELADAEDIARVVAAGAECGCSGVLLETWSTERVRDAVHAARRSGLPVIVSLAYRKRGDGQFESLDGRPPEWFAERAADWGVAALGTNCGVEIDVADCAAILRACRRVCNLALIARPNAGTPTRSADQWLYPRSPSRMAAQLPELLSAGVSLLGGCCGTTPAHIAAFRGVVDQWNQRRLESASTPT